MAANDVRLSPTQEELEKQLADAKLQVGNQFVVAYAHITPKSVAAIKIKQEAQEYYKIDLSPSPKAPIWQPRQPRVSGAERNKRESASDRSGVARGKLIKLPVDRKKPPTRKLNAMTGKGTARKQATVVNRKYFYFRVPNAMSIDALVIWINTCFKENKPEYFISAAGKTWYINKNFTDKAKLSTIGFDSGETRQDAPDQPKIDANADTK